MTTSPPRNENSGRAVAESTFDQPIARRADGDPDSHYEPDPDQVVRVSHQVRAENVPVEGPTDFGRDDRERAPGASEASAIPTQTSVWEASPAHKKPEES